MNKLNTALLLTSLLVATQAGTALASPTCTTEPKSEWLSEEAMRQKIDAMGYKDIRVFHLTSSNCYEIYGRNAAGKKAEVYFNPVDGSIVEANED